MNLRSTSNQDNVLHVYEITLSNLVRDYMFDLYVYCMLEKLVARLFKLGTRCVGLKNTSFFIMDYHFEIDI